MLSLLSWIIVGIQAKDIVLLFSSESSFHVGADRHFEDITETIWRQFVLFYFIFDIVKNTLFLSIPFYIVFGCLLLIAGGLFTHPIH